MKIATLADWFKVGLIEGIKCSKECGAQGVQIYAADELNPLEITKPQLDNIRATLKEYDQEVTALCAELGGHGLELREENTQKLRYLKAAVNTAIELDCKVITTHIGRIPEDMTSQRYQIMLEACGEISDYAKQKGVYIAVETGPEPVEQLVEFCQKCDGLAINYDPANLVMVTNVDEVQGVYTAGKYIVHTHAKDGIMKKYLGTEETYEVFATGGIEAVQELLANYHEEKPLGQGSVRFKAYLQALKDVGYDGYLTIEREVKENAKADILLAVNYLQALLGGM